MARLWHMCALLQPALIVVDPLFAAQSMRSNWQTLKNLRDLAQQIGAAVLVLHHLRAYNSRAEAGDLVKFASAVWSLDYTADGNNRLVTLRCEASQTRVPVTSVRQFPSSDASRELVAETALQSPCRAIRLRSKSPLHYAQLPEANILTRTASTSSYRLRARISSTVPHATIIADLSRRGKVCIALKSSRTIYYRLGSHNAH